jgi:hypothetical protein
MGSGDHYRVKAADMNARAKSEPNPFIRAEYENLALAYLRLADQAERNATTDIVYEPPPQQQMSQPPQQQQQAQPKKT